MSWENAEYEESTETEEMHQVLASSRKLAQEPAKRRMRYQGVGITAYPDALLFLEWNALAPGTAVKCRRPPVRFHDAAKPRGGG